MQLHVAGKPHHKTENEKREKIPEKRGHEQENQEKREKRIGVFKNSDNNKRIGVFKNNNNNNKRAPKMNPLNLMVKNQHQ